MPMKYVSYGEKSCGCSEMTKDITGCRFHLAPMTDDYVGILTDAIDSVNWSDVWVRTDATSTVCRGDRLAVLNAVKSCYLHAYRSDVHMVLEATISKGCPGDSEEDQVYAKSDRTADHEDMPQIDFPVVGKFALYPMGTDAYMSLIADVVNEGIDRGVVCGSGHYTTFLSGSVSQVFRYLEDVAARCENMVSHYIIEVTLLCNLPESEALA